METLRRREVHISISRCFNPASVAMQRSRSTLRSPRFQFLAPRPKSMLTTVSHRAMATEFSVILAESSSHLVESALEALELLDRIEADLTIYRPQSEVSRVNAEAGSRPVPVSTATFELIEKSVQWSVQTAGAFDITAGPLVRVWGFTERSGKKPSADQIRDAVAKVGYRHLRLDPDSLSVAFEVPEMEINLGAIGKGFALDELAQTLLARGVEDFLIHGGGSSILAHGNQQADGETGWAVGIAHPTKPKQRLAGIRLNNQALSTSGSGKQFFHHRGRRYGHVIDPRTGYPAGDLLSLTAVAANATDAEACSTGYFVCGTQAIDAASSENDLLPAMIGVRAEDRQDSVSVVPFAEFDWVDPPLANEQP